MKKSWVSLLVFLTLVNAGVAQQKTGPAPPAAPAIMSTTPTTNPETLQVLDNQGHQVPIGTFPPGGPFSGAAGGGGGGNGAPYLSVEQFGMHHGTQDNSPFVHALMVGLSPGVAGGYDVAFPAVAGQNYTPYYFSDTFYASRLAHFRCSGLGGDGSTSSTELVFAAGVDGFQQTGGNFGYPDGYSYGSGKLDGCTIVSLGSGIAFATQSSQTITGVNMDSDLGGTIPPTTWGPGDGVIITPYLGGYVSDYTKPWVPTGAYVTAVDGATGNLTLAPGFGVLPTVGGATAVAIFVPNTSGAGQYQDGDTLQIGNNTFTFRSTLGTTAGNVLINASNNLATFAYLEDCINNHTTNADCRAPTNVPNITAHHLIQNGYQVGYFLATTSGVGGAGYPSVYTAQTNQVYAAGLFPYGDTFGGGGYGSTQQYIVRLPYEKRFTVNTYSYPQTTPIAESFNSVTGVLTLTFTTNPIDTSGAVGLPIDLVYPYPGPYAGLYTTWPIRNTSGNVINVQATPYAVNTRATAAWVAGATAIPIGDCTIFAAAAGQNVIDASITGDPVIGVVSSCSTGSGAGTLHLASGTGVPASQTAADYLTVPTLTPVGGTLSAGNSHAIVTAGPRPPIPGDVLWSDAQYLGGMILQVNGTGFPYIVDVVGPTEITTGQNAYTTHPTAAPGQWWVIPAGVKRDGQASTANLYITQWPIGLEMACSAAYSLPNAGGMNCTSSEDRENFFIGDLIGRWTAGDNTGASSSYHEEYAKNSWIDVLEAGNVGSNYVSLNLNSWEGGQAYNGFLGDCFHENRSTGFGGYPAQGDAGCVAWAGLWPAGEGGNVLWINPQVDSPVPSNTYITHGGLAGNWVASPNPGKNDCVMMGNTTYANFMLAISPDCGWGDSMSFSYNGSGYSISDWVYGSWLNFPLYNNPNQPQFPVGLQTPAIRSGEAANDDFTGRVTLSGGTGSWPFTFNNNPGGPYTVPPNCLCAQVPSGPGVAATDACTVYASLTGLTFTGTGSDTIKYICVGRN
jgi:hypothetical protein